MTVTDKPGSVAEMCSLTSSAGVSINQIVVERQFCENILNIEVLNTCTSFFAQTVTVVISPFQLKVICETRDYEHTEKFKKILRDYYGRVKFNDPTLKCAVVE